MPRSRSRSPRRYHDAGGATDRKHDDRSHNLSTRRSRSLSRSPRRRRDSLSPQRRSRSPPRRGDRSRSRSRDHKRRRRSSSRDKKEKRRRDRSPSTSSSSDSDANEGRSRKKEKRKDKDRKDGRKEKKREKKEKRKEKKRKKAEVQWGKYGVISDIDIYTKTQEFQTWLLEERKLNPETITKDQEKREFSRFIEDYNTATLPHEKYYNMDAYEHRMSALRQGELLPPKDDIYDADADMKAIKNAHKKKLVEEDSTLSREQLMELRKLQQERNEISRRKLLGMDIKTNFGVRMDETFD